jgi:N-carbamoyl-L-amino-acid hydrolase
MAVARLIDGGALRERLVGLLPIGRNGPATTRLAWTAEDAAAAEWFSAQADSAGLAVGRDPGGNLWAVPAAPPPWWALGSHLDTVREGGAFDGALGVAAGFEIAARSAVPVAVISFADEEGARFNTPTFGSRALTGVLDHSVLDRRDASGVLLRDALGGAGVDAERIAGAPEWLGRLRGFLELHIDQTTDLARAGRPAGVVRGLATRMRVRAELAGRADHAGTTPVAERRDALAAAARLIVAALDLAGEGAPAAAARAPAAAPTGAPAPGSPRELVATASRILVEPNALTTVPSRASVWLDARSPDADAVEGWRAGVERAASDLARGTRVEIALTTESHSPGCEFDPALRARLLELSRELGEPAPELDCLAGHDAGMLAASMPAAMVFVRNESGVSHSPEEAVDLDDAAFGAELLLRLVEQVAG